MNDIFDFATARDRGIGAVAGLLQPGSDVGDARWVALEDLYELDITKQAGELARRWLQQRA